MPEQLRLALERSPAVRGSRQTPRLKHHTQLVMVAGLWEHDVMIPPRPVVEIRSAVLNETEDDGS